MICKSCGRANELGARFCKSCGAPLESDESMQQNNTYQSENVCQQNNQYVMPESMYSGTTRMTKKEFNECANIKSIIIMSLLISAIISIINIINSMCLINFFMQFYTPPWRLLYNKKKNNEKIFKKFCKKNVLL